MSIVFVISNWDPQPWVDAFAKALPNRELKIWDEDAPETDADYCVCWQPLQGVLAQIVDLKGIFSLGAGVDHILSDPNLPDTPIMKVVDPDLTARMSEYVCLQALSILRKPQRYRAYQALKRWVTDTTPIASDVTVGIMGMGEIGSDAAKKLQALGFQVAGWSRTPKSIAGITNFVGQAALPDFISACDIIVNILPLTPETDGLIAGSFFEATKRQGVLGGAHLINLGRGKSQRESDILDALRSGALQTATLDVFEVEPLPQESELWTHPRVTVTPHNAGTSNPSTIAKLVADQIRSFESGNGFLTQIDQRRGY